MSENTLADLADHPSAKGRYVDLVLEGGAVWGIALVGALCVIEEYGYLPQNIAGTSAGAIVASMLAAGYRATEIRDLMFRQDFADLADKTWKAKIPLIGIPLSVLTELGINKGDAILARMRKLLADKGVHTFHDLVHPEYAGDPQFRYRLQVIASDITGRRLLVLPRDAHLFGIPPDSLEVALAVRMSMSIPLFYKPIILRDMGKRRYLITDGSMLSNFPVWLFDSPDAPEWPTFGLRLTQPDPQDSLASALQGDAAPVKQGIGMLIDFGSSLLHTMMEAHDRMYMEETNLVRTIMIPTRGVPSTNFNLTPEQVQTLYRSGRQAADAFLQNWSFPQYIARFRSGTHAIPREAFRRS